MLNIGTLGSTTLLALVLVLPENNSLLDLEELEEEELSELRKQYMELARLAREKLANK